jgi:hypothetical protein
MKAHELKVGQYFTVQTPAGLEARICLSTDNLPFTVRWGLPGEPRFWCDMGGQCDVELCKDREAAEEIGTPFAKGAWAKLT